jgi:sulfoxide reductase heme-binding subunit YedZ
MQRFAKPFALARGRAPFAWLVFRAFTDRLTANPVEDITLTTGIWALRFLLVTLAVTPLRRITGWNRVIQYRRMLGLLAFFYATVHLLTYFTFDLVFDFSRIIADVWKRPFITAGMLAFVLMVPLAITSTRGWMGRLGRRWQLLHRLIYVSAAAAVVHFLWKVKVVVGEPVYYAVILGVLLSFRILWRFRPSARA